jgi:hypothetical protein
MNEDLNTNRRAKVSSIIITNQPEIPDVGFYHRYKEGRNVHLQQFRGEIVLAN